MKESILLLGHGSPKKDANNLERVGKMLHGMLHTGCTEDCVKVAYLQFVEPGIPEAIRECVDQGAKKIILHPFFLSAGMHVTKDIPGMIEEARGRYPGVKFIYTEPLGVHEKLAHIVMERISAADELAPPDIEKRSFDILSAEADLSSIPADRLPIVQRVIHATGDFEFKNTLTFHPDAVACGLQAIKAGILEIADIFVVNKADRDGADKARRELETMIGMNEYAEGDWIPPVLTTVAKSGTGTCLTTGGNNGLCRCGGVRRIRAPDGPGDEPCDRHGLLAVPRGDRGACLCPTRGGELRLGCRGDAEVRALCLDGTMCHVFRGHLLVRGEPAGVRGPERGCPGHRLRRG